MKSPILSVVLTMIPVAAIAAPTGQFNLVCSGLRDPMLGGGQVQYRSIYRIDLDRGEWCEDECRGTFPIVEAKPLVIVLEDSDEPGTSVMNYIERETGRHRVVVADRGRFTRPRSRIVSSSEGQCEKAPFTAFPTFKTKF